MAFSDPWFDRIEQTWPLAGTGPLPGWPWYTGRVADGWLMPHQHPPGLPTHNDAGNVSQDVYHVIATDSPGGTWGPEGYVTSWGPDVENFWGQNGQDDTPTPTAAAIQTEVEWAVTVSPVADLWVAKAVTPTTVLPGDWLTFTIAFTNAGSLPAEHVVLTDTLPYWLIDPSWSYWTSNGLTVTTRVGKTYVWDLPDLAWQEWGRITVRAQVGTGYSWPGSTVVNNEGAWAAGSPVTTTVTAYQLYLPYTMKDY